VDEFLSMPRKGNLKRRSSLNPEKAIYVQTKAARLLGISRRILKYKMDKYGIGAHRIIRVMNKVPFDAFG